MDDSGRAGQAEALRADAASLLQEAARCNDGTERDRLLRDAMAQLDRARRLLAQSEDAAGLGPSGPATKSE